MVDNNSDCGVERFVIVLDSSVVDDKSLAKKAEKFVNMCYVKPRHLATATAR